MSRMAINTIRALSERFDEFEAVFFPRYARVVNENEESFGFSMKVFRRYIELPLLSEAEYRTLRQRGIIFDTNITVPQGEETRIMTWNEMGVALRNFSLLSAMRSRRAILRLPIPIAYVEELTDRLVELSPPPIEVVIIDSDTMHMVGSEEVITRCFRRQYLKPDSRNAFRPDQMFFGANGLNFCTVGAPSLSNSFDRRIVLAGWMRCRVRNWKSFVEFRNPLAFLGERQEISDVHQS